MENKKYKIRYLKNCVEWHFMRYESARLVLEGKSNLWDIEKAKFVYEKEKTLLDNVISE